MQACRGSLSFSLQPPSCLSSCEGGSLGPLVASGSILTPATVSQSSPSSVGRHSLAQWFCPQMNVCAQTSSSAFPKSKEAFPDLDPLIPPRPAVRLWRKLVSLSDETLDLYLGQQPLSPRQHLQFLQ